MFVRETGLLTREEHVESLSKLANDPNWTQNWFKSVVVIHEDEHILMTRWEDNGEIVTNTNLIKDGLCGRAIVVRNPKGHQLHPHWPKKLPQFFKMIYLTKSED